RASFASLDALVDPSVTSLPVGRIAEHSVCVPRQRAAIHREMVKPGRAGRVVRLGTGVQINPVEQQPNWLQYVGGCQHCLPLVVIRSAPLGVVEPMRRYAHVVTVFSDG